ncbi:MAG: hypothetical protein Kow0059_06090 [Candidatus Sumerlaeia bacterium]
MPRILIIEDMPSVREEIAAVLGFEGYEVLEAADGDEGVRLAREALPDVVICDILMPKMSGYEVLEKLRSEESTALIPFIFLTAKTSRADMRQGMTLGADDYLTKPFTADELLGAIQSRLARRTQVQAHVAQQLSDVRRQLDLATHYDWLTGLPNRLKLREDLQRAFEPDSHSPALTLMVLDLDRFHTFNDALGPDFGDELLKIVTERIKACLPTNASVFRQVGDKFIVLWPHVTDESAISHQVVELLGEIKRPIEYKNQTIRVTACAGIARYPHDAGGIDDLILHAELAMMQAKHQGLDSYKIFDPSQRNEAMDRVKLKSDLYDALDRHELHLMFQPQIQLEDGRCTGVEALLRWNHPAYGAVSPSIFIPIAEESGMIIPIGEWVLREACRRWRQFAERHSPALEMSVNVSSRQLVDTLFLERVERALRDFEVPAEQLNLEITESLVMSEVETNITALNHLKSRGIRLTIDDFGTGYSSLAYLKRFSIDRLKVDRSFVRDLTVDSSDASIIEGILRIAGSLGIDVIAEGVETREQLEFLRRLGCSGVQGYLISRPIPPDELALFLQQGPRIL